MGIQKINHSKAFYSAGAYCHNGSGTEVLDNLVLGPDSGDDSDDEELIELNCELGMVEGHVCSMPYDLYDLPDLKDILSIDTWNSCLTEEERFHLSAYLPDMDEHTFWLTMKELFDGSNIYFGNPLDMFFKRLRGGFYPPTVAHYREGLQFLQRKKHYHMLRSYHDKMAQTFVEMSRIWDQCGKGAGVEERISLWGKRNKQHKDNTLLDLNKFPGDDNLLSEDVSMDTKPPGRKRAEAATVAKFVPPNCQGKGFLKMKASGNRSCQNHAAQVVRNDKLEQGRSIPKGVLKIVPKQPPSQLEQSEVPRGLKPNIIVKSQGLLDVKFSRLHASLPIQEAGGLCSSVYMGQIIDHRVHSALDQPLCLLNQQDDTLRASSRSESSDQKIRRGKIPSLDERSLIGLNKVVGGGIGRVPREEHDFPISSVGGSTYDVDGKNLWPELHAGAQDFSLNSLRSFPFAIPCHGREQYLTLRAEQSHHFPKFPEVVPRVLNLGKRKPETVIGQPTEMKGKSEAGLKISGSGANRSSVTEGFKRDSVLPLTYKRRKVLAKVKSSNVGEP
ncbi:unnamed protein product [Linum tenue]|uniref:DEUBAD domain-containing protein n=2 Tax=Linum tenue TaxID=586396 RepID=A0AAV0RYA1_9ROSI|nr:unnamed protein product [Linum tenue]